MKSFLKNPRHFSGVARLCGVASLLWQVAGTETIGVGTLVEEINAGKLKKVTIQGDTLAIDLKDAAARQQSVKKEGNDSFGQIMQNYGVSEDARKGIAIEIKDESS